MGVRSRFSLPSLGMIGAKAGAPNVGEARAALGGRVSTAAGAGACVVVTMKRGAPSIGVVVCVHDDERDVWIGEGRFVRADPGRLSALAEVEPTLARVQSDALGFARMREGDVVIYLDGHTAEHRGVLLEKCRYGGLVDRGDGAIIAVSFRRLRAV